MYAAESLLRNYPASRLALSLALSIGLPGDVAVAQQALQAQPAPQVRVSSFTPVTPRLGGAVDAVPLSEIGAVTIQDCKPEQDAYVQASVEYHRFVNSLHKNNYLNTDPAFYYKYMQDLYFNGEGMPRRMITAGRWSRARLDESLRYFSERSRQNVPACTEMNACIQAKSLRDSRLQACLWQVALNRGKGSSAPPLPVPAPRVVSRPAPSPAPAAATQAAPEDGFKRKLEQMGRRFELDQAGNYKVVLSVGETKRTQLIYVTGKTLKLGGLVVREFYAPAAKISTSVDGAKALELLAASHTKIIGSWEIHGDYLMYTAKVSDGISAEDARTVMNTVANIADEAEVKLTGQDVY